MLFYSISKRWERRGERERLWGADVRYWIIFYFLFLWFMILNIVSFFVLMINCLFPNHALFLLFSPSFLKLCVFPFSFSTLFILAHCLFWNQRLYFMMRPLDIVKYLIGMDRCMELGKKIGNNWRTYFFAVVVEEDGGISPIIVYKNHLFCLPLEEVVNDGKPRLSIIISPHWLQCFLFLGFTICILFPFSTCKIFRWFYNC